MRVQQTRLIPDSTLAMMQHGQLLFDAEVFQ